VQLRVTPRTRAQDAIAETVRFANNTCEWMVEGDITACFDEIAHPALLERARRRIGDKRVLALVKAFLKAGILGQDGALRDSTAGAPQGGIVTPPTQLAMLGIVTVRVAAVDAVGVVAVAVDAFAEGDAVSDGESSRGRRGRVPCSSRRTSTAHSASRRPRTLDSTWNRRADSNRRTTAYQAARRRRSWFSPESSVPASGHVATLDAPVDRRSRHEPCHERSCRQAVERRPMGPRSNELCAAPAVAAATPRSNCCQGPIQDSSSDWISITAIRSST
jgi:hypothetical protein